MRVSIKDRLPAYRRKPAIDRSDLLLDLLFPFTVGRYRTPRRHDIQDENYFLAPFGIPVEEKFKSGQPLHKPLCIIEPVNRKNDLFIFEVMKGLVPDLLHFRICGRRVESAIIDPYREKIDPYKPVLVLKVVKIALDTEDHFYRLKEMLDVVVRMKSDKIRSHNSMQQHFLPLRWH